MTENALQPLDWVRIKYGEYEDRCGRISMKEKNGRFKVCLYDRKNEPGPLVSLVGESLERIPPFSVSRSMLQDLCCGRLFYADFAEQVFPPFHVKAEESYDLDIADIRDALQTINRKDEPLEVFKEWFWMILNVFYEDLNIRDRYDPDLYTDFPKNYKDIFSVVFGMTEKLYWKLEERYNNREDTERYIVKFDREPSWDRMGLGNQDLEKEAYLAVCEDITGRVDSYLNNLRLPKEEWTYSAGQMRHFINTFETNEALEKATEEELAVYLDFVARLYAQGDLTAVKAQAWGHYTGNRAFRQNWMLSRKYLMEYLERTGDPYAANSLGYIYYYGRCTDGTPQYEEAFKFFSYGALAGIDESIYKSGDMLIYGRGTQKNIDMGLNLIVDGYRDALDDFCSGNFDNKFADYALRMGNVCRDNLIYGMGMRDAYKFYLEAEYAIRKRRAISDHYGDKTVEASIERELEKIQDHLSLDMGRSELRADFPVYINQIYDDTYPVKVYLSENRKENEYSLIIRRFRVGENDVNFPLPDRMKTVPQILVTYPELSYCNLVSEISFTLENVGVVKKVDRNGEYFLSDGFRRNDKTGALEFYLGSNLVAAVEAKWFVIHVDKNR